MYYKDDTHYFVMTAKKQCLLKLGVLRQVGPGPSGEEGTVHPSYGRTPPSPASSRSSLNVGSSRSPSVA